MTSSIEHDPEQHRFCHVSDGHVSHLLYRPAGEGLVDFVSTYVDPALRGRGVGARLVEHALAWARESDLKVIPTCWFVAELIERKPEYASLLAS